MRGERSRKRNLIAKAKSGKIQEEDFVGKIKYHYTQSEREYILKKVSSKYTALAYNNPLPINEKEICKVEGVWSDKSTIHREISWYFDVLKKYSNELKRYLSIVNKIEIAILQNDIDLSYDLLDKLDQDVCCSFFSLQTELYINEINGKTEDNKDLIKEFPFESTPPKLIILLDFARIRIDSKISYWQFDSTIDHHKNQYSKDSRNLIDYIDYKLNPVRFDNELSELEFLLYFDSDFSIIDRYNSLKELLSIVFFESSIGQEERTELIELIKESSIIFEDEYWNKLLLLIDNETDTIKINLKNKQYFEIQDFYLNGNYEEVINRCFVILQSEPNFSDLYIFYVKSIIFVEKNLDNFEGLDTELFSILNLIFKILSKESDYHASRDILLDKYYKISHFDFSMPILEFLFNEYRLEIPKGVKYLAYLKSKAFRYNSYALFESHDKFIKLNVDYPNLTISKVKESFLNKTTNPNLNWTFFSFKTHIGCLIYLNEQERAIDELLNYKFKHIEFVSKNQFIETWFDKTLLKCYFAIKDLQKVSNLIVETYFKNQIAYDHFYDEKLIHAFDNLDTQEVFNEISIPILFEIYNQSQTAIYDRIADFLICVEIQRPSEIFKRKDKFKHQMFVHFLEKVCTKENIQDSPFLNSIESLEGERIKILNYLKVIDEDKTEVYNSEILSITKEASLRKGLLQIHESRIYIDDANIEKHLAQDLPEIFERYLGFTDITYSAISSMQLDRKIDRKSILITFFLLEPISEELLHLYAQNIDPRADPNAVAVPIIRFTYFLTLFNTIRHEFIYSEDYGFRSFLSMRIRHGTFSNVLRSVFDKHHLISSKEADSENYMEIKYWEDKVSASIETISTIQGLLKDFSRDIDSFIDTGLTWINVKDDQGDNPQHIFNLNFTEDELYTLYHNRLGKIQEYDIFVKEVFNILYERLDRCLVDLKEKISTELSTSFLKMLENLQNNLDAVSKDGDNLNSLEQSIVSCKTDLQTIVSQIIKWFNISKNQYIEEFPIDMIIQNSLDYINSIHTESIQISTVNIKNNCVSKFQGKFFESFGDMLINLFDNIVSKNRELGRQLVIGIEVNENNENLVFNIKNNIPATTNKKELKRKISEIVKNVEDFKTGGLNSSFEEGSGFLKICKCISVDLEREEYTVLPMLLKDTFEVNIEFELKNLTV